MLKIDTATKPLWIPTKPHTDTTASPISIQITEQQRERAKLIAVEAKRIKTLEAKFGKKPSVRHSTGVPHLVREYWNKTLKNPSSLEELRCSPVRPGSNGWITVCDYRAKNSSGILVLVTRQVILLFIFRKKKLHSSVTRYSLEELS